MRRVETFKISDRPYAVDLNRYRMDVQARGTMRPWVRVGAVWYRRKEGVTRACIGTLETIQDQAPGTVEEFLERYRDGRYGGTALGRWDGRRYWGAEEPETREAHLAVLRPMLERYPAVPDGYDGWWTFRPAQAR